jgi:hypothetical protein
MENCLDQGTCARRVERLARHQAPVEDGAEDGLDGKFGIDAGCEDGTLPSPGGWNRFALEVTDLENVVASLRQQGTRFRNDIVTAIGGKQILQEDPSGNPVELFEPARAEARLSPPSS